MNKVTLLIVSILTCSLCSAQYGIDGAISGATNTGIWVASEKPNLKTIEELQEEIIVNNGIIFNKELRLQEIKMEKYKALETVDNTVREATLLLQIYKSSENLYNLQEMTYNSIEGNEEVIFFVDNLEADLLQEVYFLLDDIIVGLTGGKENLMNSAQRLDFLYGIHQQMDELTLKASRIYEIAVSMSATLKFDTTIDPLEIDLAPYYEMSDYEN